MMYQTAPINWIIVCSPPSIGGKIMKPNSSVISSVKNCIAQVLISIMGA